MEDHTILLLKIIVFILVVIGYIGYTVYKNKTKDKTSFLYPPWPSKCPDHWEVVGKNTCKNVKKIGGKCNIEDNELKFNFDDKIFHGKEGLYYKCKWAHQCNVSWEGIDNLCI